MEPRTSMGDARELWWTGEVGYRRVETSKGPVEFADVGEGRPILYFHGTGAGADAAVMMERSLAADGFRLIVPNRPGYFGTPLSCGRSPGDCADLAAELLERLGVERVVVIGTSGGGVAAPTFAARHPRKAAALVLQCALSHPLASPRWMPAPLRLLYPLFRYHRVCLPMLRYGFRREMRKLRRDPESLLAYLSGPRYAEICDDSAARTLARLLADSELRCAEQPAGIENDWANAVGEPWLTPGSVSCPTLIVHDRADPISPLVQAEWVLHSIAGAELCDVHAGGHLIWVGRDGARMREERAAFIRRHYEGDGNESRR